MRGESKNVVYVMKKTNNGYSEVIYNENGEMVTNSYNQGSCNYFLYETEPIKHFGYDIRPSYIFEDDKNSLDKIIFEILSKGEKIFYQFFAYVIFNKEYKISLNEDNRENLRKESEYYF